MRLNDRQAAAVYEVIVNRGIHPGRENIQKPYLEGLEKLRRASLRYYKRCDKI